MKFTDGDLGQIFEYCDPRPNTGKAYEHYVFILDGQETYNGTMMVHSNSELVNNIIYRGRVLYSYNAANVHDPGTKVNFSSGHMVFITRLAGA